MKFFSEHQKNELDIFLEETQINGNTIDSKIREETSKKIRMSTEEKFGFANRESL